MTDPEEELYIAQQRHLLETVPFIKGKRGLTSLPPVALALLVIALLLFPAVLLCLGGNVLKAPPAARQLCLGMWASLAITVAFFAVHRLF